LDITLTPHFVLRQTFQTYADLDVKIGFGKGIPARVPWIAFLAPGMQVRNGIYPVYLYYRHIHVLVLAYGIRDKRTSGVMASGNNKLNGND
jgi:hypothetical protein